MATAGTAQVPATVLRGHVILVDATRREHPMLLNQCRYLEVRSLKMNTYYVHEAYLTFGF